MKITAVRVDFQDLRYRAPMKFGANVVDRITVLTVRVGVAGSDGRTAAGLGAMTLGNAWSWPGVPYDTSLAAMKAHATALCRITEDCGTEGTPLELFHALLPRWRTAGGEAARAAGAPAAMPDLCAFVTASAFDLALHDAFGRLLGRNSFACYRATDPPHDLARYLGPRFAGERLDRYLRPRPRAHLFVYHTVGALDPLTRAEVSAPAGDGRPDCLAEWIDEEGIRCFKVKAGGAGVPADLERMRAVHAVASEALGRRSVRQWRYAVDFNETCPDVDYLLEFLTRLRRDSRSIYTRIELVEQPLPRDAAPAPEHHLQRAARLKPVVADESVFDPDTLERARALGYTGVAIKACKTLSSSLLIAAAARKAGLLVCAMDLTCPGASFLASAALASRLPGVSAFEANARQYLPPAAHEPWSEAHPGVFQVRDGRIRSAELARPGLGMREDAGAAASPRL